MALPLVLVITVVLSLVVVSVATYATANLTYGHVAEDRSDRLSAADAAMQYAIDQLKTGNAPCIYSSDPVVLPAVNDQFNGATAQAVCDVIGGGIDDIQAWAAVVTGQGVASNLALVTTQSGSNEKILNGPVWISRVDSNSFGLASNAGLRIENGPLVHYGGAAPCTNVSKYTVAGAPPKLPAEVTFEPNLIFGPICSSSQWYNRAAFLEPSVPANLNVLTARDGSIATTVASVFPFAVGSFTDLNPAGPDGPCRVFEPGRYVIPPDFSSTDAYFKSGDYYLDFRDPSSPDVNNPIAAPMSASRMAFASAIVTAGKPAAGLPVNGVEIPNSRCNFAKAADSVGGATFYFGGKAHLVVGAGGSFEVMPRLQGDDYVSIHALCQWDSLTTDTGYQQELNWCVGGTGGLGVSNESTLRAPADNSGGNPPNPSIIYTLSGNGKEVVAHGYIFAPLAQMEFGNVSSTATQKLLGGLTLARLVLQSATSAQNFEIGVGGNPVDADLVLTATATKDGQTTQIQAIVEYRPLEVDFDDRLAVNSWRVCDLNSC